MFRFVIFYIIMIFGLFNIYAQDIEHISVINIPKDVKDYFRIWGKEHNTCMRSGLVILDPLKDVGEHSTENFEELVIPLEGQGKMLVNKKEYFFSKNQILHIGPNTKHNVFNISTKHVLKYIYVVADNKCNKN